MSTEEIIREGKGTIVDVRTPEEFNAGHAAGSINIPLNLIPLQVEDLKEMVQPLILCCATGGRSGQAHSYLLQHGIDCFNAGSWLNIKQVQSQKA